MYTFPEEDTEMLLALALKVSQISSIDDNELLKRRKK